jgi:hypothetical protein
MFMKKLYLLLIMSLLLVFTGCQTSMLIENADIKTLTPLLTDYAHLNGYRFLYRDDTKGSYRIHLGQMYIPAQITAYQESITLIDTKNVQYDLTKYEETAFKAIKQKDQYVDLVIMLRVFPQNNDIKIVLESDGRDYYHPTASQANKLKRYLENSGYTVRIL